MSTAAEDPPPTTPVLVVGGTSGIGSALVSAYADRGERAVVWDVAGEADVRCDIAEPPQIERAVAETLARFGVPRQITVTVGVGRSGTMLEETAESWDRVIAVNTRGPWLVLQALVRVLADQGLAASIVVTSSISGRIADRGMGLYCASKAALDMLVRVAAAEWAPLGIRVNAVAPGVTQTPMLGRAPTDRGWLRHVADRTALGRLGQPDDIAAAILVIHGLDWVTGQVLDCDGGLSLHSPIDAFGEQPSG